MLGGGGGGGEGMLLRWTSSLFLPPSSFFSPPPPPLSILFPDMMEWWMDARELKVKERPSFYLELRGV